MSRFVPYLADEAIERDSVSLIKEYEHARGVTIEPPIPIEDILEKHLKLRVEFDDLHARHNVPQPENGQTDILGAVYGDGSIFIDESLDPEENPVREGRYRFTLAHEGGGHWRLHQHLIKEDTAQTSLLGDVSIPVQKGSTLRRNSGPLVRAGSRLGACAHHVADARQGALAEGQSFSASIVD